MSLLDRIGGENTVSALIDIFYSKIQSDMRVSHLLGYRDIEYLKSSQKSFLSRVLRADLPYSFGGASQPIYELPSPPTNVTQSDAFILKEYLSSTLDDLRIPPDITMKIWDAVSGGR